MPEIKSPCWNEETGSCEKHCLPTIPCPTCMAEQDKDIYVVVSEMDLIVLEAEAFEAEEEGREAPDIDHLLPADHAHWLKNRVM
jgi:hypothetical protein